MMPNELLVERGEGIDYDCLGAYEMYVVALTPSLDGLRNCRTFHFAYKTWWQDEAEDVAAALRRNGLVTRVEPVEEYREVWPGSEWECREGGYVRTSWQVFAHG